MLILSYVAIAGIAYAGDTPETVTDRRLSFGDLFQAGGPIMWILTALSVGLLSLVIYCFLLLRPSGIASDELRDSVLAHLDKKNLGGVRDACSTNESMLANIIRSTLDHSAGIGPKSKEVMASVGGRYAATLRQRIGYLSNIGVIAPMLGLLGTVVGLIGAFNTWAPQQGASQSGLSMNIAQALGTTAFGLVIGIPAMGFYYYLRGRANLAIAILEEVADEIAEKLSTLRPEGRTARAAEPVSQEGKE